MLPNNAGSGKDLITGLVAPKASYASREEQSSSQMSILDMPNIESNQPRFIDPLMADRERRRTKTPEPIVEIYSDSDDTSFDDFEKNIYNQISRRALIQSRLVARKEAAGRASGHDDELSHLKVDLCLV